MELKERDALRLLFSPIVVGEIPTFPIDLRSGSGMVNVEVRATPENPGQKTRSGNVQAGTIGVRV